MDYLLNFFGGTYQITGLLGAGAVWLGLAAIGSAFTNTKGLTAGTPYYGWGLVTALYTFLGVFTGISFTWLAWFLFAVTVGCGIFLVRRHGVEILRRPVMIFALSLPLVALVAAMSASQWDEFSHWLPSARYLLVADGFPNAADPQTGASFPAYPYGWPVLVFMGSLVSGGLHENIGPLLNLFALFTFGIAMLDVLGERTGVKIDRKRSWAAIAIALLVATILNPAFVQKLVLTSYSDASTMVAVGLATILAWMFLNRLAEGQSDDDVRVLVWQLALTLVVLIAVRPANLIPFVALLIATAIAGFRSPTIPMMRLVRLLFLAALPAVLVYAVWRFYVAHELSGQEMSIRPISAWHLDLIVDVLARMGSVLARKGVYLAMMLVVLGFGIRALFRCRTSLDRLAILASGIFVAYNLFLLFTYMAVFGQNDALRAASYWRYNTHVALAGLVFAVVALSMLWDRWSPGTRTRAVFCGVAIILIVGLPFALTNKIRFDREPPKPFFRAAAAKIAPHIGSGDAYLIIDPHGSGESNVITRYHIWPSGEFLGYVSAFQGNVDRLVAESLQKRAPKFLVLYSSTDAISGLLGIKTEPDTAYLLERSNGDWEVVGQWQSADLAG